MQDALYMPRRRREVRSSVRTSSSASPLKSCVRADELPYAMLQPQPSEPPLDFFSLSLMVIL